MLPTFLPLPTLNSRPPISPPSPSAFQPPVCLTPPPLVPTSSRTAKPLIYSLALSQIATSLENPPKTAKLTIDLPPEYSETRAGTLVSRFENNLNLCEKILQALGAGKLDAVGGDVQICDNVNPQGGGEYLTDDEVMVGVKGDTGIGRMMMLINAGVDVDTLKQVKGMEAGDNREGMLVLLNCGLDRLSWLDKLKLGKYFNDFEVLYCLKRVGGNGWLFKCGQEEWGIWVEAPEGIKLLSKSVERPKAVDVEREVRMAVEGMRGGK